MLPLMDVLRINPEQQVGQPPVHGRVRQAQVDADRGQQAEEEAEAERAEAAVRLERGDRAVPVLVEEVDVLLEHGAVRVARGPVVCLGPVWGVERGGDVGARGACVGWTCYSLSSRSQEGLICDVPGLGSRSFCDGVGL